jgi:hypothetical protein
MSRFLLSDRVAFGINFGLEEDAPKLDLTSFSRPVGLFALPSN